MKVTVDEYFLPFKKTVFVVPFSLSFMSLTRISGHDETTVPHVDMSRKSFAK